MVDQYYASDTSDMGGLGLSRYGTVPFRGPKLQTNSTFFVHADFGSRGYSGRRYQAQYKGAQSWDVPHTAPDLALPTNYVKTGKD